MRALRERWRCWLLGHAWREHPDELLPADIRTIFTLVRCARCGEKR